MQKSFRAVIAGLALVALMLSPALPASAIVNGSPDAGEHPFVGELLFYLSDEVDPRFDEPGAWFTCSGTLIDPDTVVTAGHCTHAVGVEGKAPRSPLHGGTDMWFSTAEAPDYSILPSSATFAPHRNDARYDAWSAALDASPGWSEARSTFTHPDFDPGTFLLHDVGVVELSEPISLPEYGTLPSQNYLDRYYSKNAKKTGRFEAVGYGLEASSPKSSSGGDTRRKVDQKLVSFKGAHGLKNISVAFSHSKGGTCFGDSGGPTFDVSTPARASQNLFVTVTSFGMNDNCTSGGAYRLDQPDDLAFLANPAAAYN